MIGVNFPELQDMESAMPKSSNKGSNPCLLVGDIGGTNVRLALADHGSSGFSQKATYECADFASADMAIEAYLAETGAPRPQVICIAAAGPVVDGNVRFTNNSWSLDAAALGKNFHNARLRLINDFEACAYAIPQLQPVDCLQVGPVKPRDLGKSDFSVGVIGPGTGLGAAGLHSRGSQLLPIVGEAGHVGFAPETQVQMNILEQLRSDHDRVSDERLVSGNGVVNIYRALTRIEGKPVTQVTAKEVFALAAANKDPLAAEAVQVFFEILGQVAGNLALSLGASDGIYIAGGIVTRDPALMLSSRFRSGFERKGRHRSLMEKIPTQIIMHPDPGLLGASYLARRVHEEA